MPLKDVPFAEAEFKERLSKVRKEMEKQELDGLLVMNPEDMYWLTGYRSMGFFAFQVLVVTHEGEPVMVSRKLEELIFHNNAWCNSFFSYHDYEDPVETTVKVLQELNLIGKRLGVPMESSYLKPLSLKKMESLLSNTSLTDTTLLVSQLRWVKSPAELECIKKAAEFTRIGFLAGINAAEEGGTENDIAAAFLNSMIIKGSEKSSSGPLIGSGLRSAFGHSSWENNILKQGDIIFLEGGGCVKRYHAGAMRTISIGQPSEFAKRLEEASHAGVNAAISILKPGVTSGEVDMACRQAVENLGVGECFNHRAGYSIGIGFSSWIDGFSLKPNDPTVIKENMVLHVVPCLTTEEIGVAISETVVVTPHGGEKLVDLEQKIYIR